MNKEQLVSLAKSDLAKTFVEALAKQRLLFLNQLGDSFFVSSSSEELRNKLAGVAFGISYVIGELQRLDTDLQNSDLYKLPE
ncbi:MAG: hypothetical protein ULS35scaffold63_13 [Phage 33_17]|nr:MAG: hypothetical protein ULS35scaffold63_13 [Phage 33_17]